MCDDNLKFDISGPVVLGVTLSRLCCVAVYFHVSTDTLVHNVF